MTHFNSWSPSTNLVPRGPSPSQKMSTLFCWHRPQILDSLLTPLADSSIQSTFRILLSVTLLRNHCHLSAGLLQRPPNWSPAFNFACISLSHSSLSDPFKMKVKPVTCLKPLTASHLTQNNSPSPDSGRLSLVPLPP